MPKSDQFKLIRTGSVRTSTGRGGRSGRYVESEAVVVPEIEDQGLGPFTGDDLHALARRLQNPRWTRGTRNIYGLEGLLTALLVLPLGLRLGAWLPLVWNDGGWKVPAALQGAEDSREFLDLTIGFMRHLDRGFRATPPRFDSSIDILASRHDLTAVNAQNAWVQGFGLAVSEVRFHDMPLDPEAQISLVTIAKLLHPSSDAMEPDRKAHETLRQSVLTLARTRTSRGPLGPLI